MVVLEVGVSILYGLEVCVEVKMKIFKEIDMNSFVENLLVLSCVWFGVTFLRGLGGTLPTQMRDYR